MQKLYPKTEMQNNLIKIKKRKVILSKDYLSFYAILG